MIKKTLFNTSNAPLHDVKRVVHWATAMGFQVMEFKRKCCASLECQQRLEREMCGSLKSKVVRYVWTPLFALLRLFSFSFFSHQWTVKNRIAVHLSYDKMWQYKRLDKELLFLRRREVQTDDWVKKLCRKLTIRVLRCCLSSIDNFTHANVFPSYGKWRYSLGSPNETIEISSGNIRRRKSNTWIWMFSVFYHQSGREKADTCFGVKIVAACHFTAAIMSRSFLKLEVRQQKKERSEKERQISSFSTALSVRSGWNRQNNRQSRFWLFSWKSSAGHTQEIIHNDLISLHPTFVIHVRQLNFFSSSLSITFQIRVVYHVTIYTRQTLWLSAANLEYEIHSSRSKNEIEKPNSFKGQWLTRLIFSNLRQGQANSWLFLFLLGSNE